MSIKGSLRKIKNFWKGCKTDSRISIFKIGKMIAKNRFKISREFVNMIYRFLWRRIGKRKIIFKKIEALLVWKTIRKILEIEI